MSNTDFDLPELVKQTTAASMHSFKAGFDEGFRQGFLDGYRDATKKALELLDKSLKPS